MLLQMLRKAHFLLLCRCNCGRFVSWSLFSELQSGLKSDPFSPGDTAYTPQRHNNNDRYDVPTLLPSFLNTMLKYCKS